MGGFLSRSVRVTGTFIPVGLAGRCRVAMLTLWMFTLTCATLLDYWTTMISGLRGVLKTLQLRGVGGMLVCADIIV
eukprot:CAMPEP_0194309324 /NCGR_PEP_ID=MMETSP0171-20130528/6301_1 /TAXON_ID=218684 /ORGANISM="Corethron pennatum, Strain L29A3" /LENGTH=75 /DNA_ID=CAMNT_0039062447 /DNA_START=126 /DNA_END=353 /DNA_ORIENTATION=+